MADKLEVMLMIDAETKLPVSDTNGSHPDKVLAELMRLAAVRKIKQCK
jgi:hypothetical protein